MKKITIAVGYCYYNDLRSIQRGLPTFVNDVDFVFAIDGRFSMRDDEDYSTDGSTEFLQTFPNVIIRKFIGMEHEKRNQYLELADEMEVDVLLIIDTDEYVKNADWEQFRFHLSKIVNYADNIQGVKFYSMPDQWSSYPRIWLRPNEIRYWKTHNIFVVNGNLVRSPNRTPVKGIEMGMDDSLRDPEYLKKTSEYQARMIAYEKPLRKQYYSGVV